MPSLPVVVAVSLCGLALVVVILRALISKRAGMALPTVLRALAVLLLAAVAVDPSVTAVREQLVPARSGVVVDGTRSMSLGAERPGGKTRLETAVDASRGRAGAAPDFRFLLTDDELLATPTLNGAAAAGEQTDLRLAGRELAAMSEVSAVTLLSDGADTRGARPEDLSAAPRIAGLRVDARLVGRDRVRKDAGVMLVQLPEQVRAGAEFELLAGLRRTPVSDAPVTLEILRDGQRVVTQQVRGVSPRRLQAVKLRAPGPGRYTYTVRVPPSEGELARHNNVASGILTVVPDRTRVLLVAGSPSMEYAFLRRCLLAEKELELTALVRKAGPAGFWLDGPRPQKADLGATLTRTHFDAVLLQDVPAASLRGVSGRIEGTVRNGAGLAVLAGPDSAGGPHPLASLLPMTTAGGYVDELVRVEPSRGGGGLARTIGDALPPLLQLPPWRGRALVEALKPSASTVLTASGAPLMASWTVARGRVVFLGTAGTHRWAFHADASDRDREALRGFWGVVVDWLTEPQPDDPVTAEFARPVVPAGGAARLLVQVSDRAGDPVTGAQVQARVQGATGEAQVRCAAVDEAPGRYEADVQTLGEGKLKATVQARTDGRLLGEATATAEAVGMDTELLLSRPRAGLLRAVAAASGGRFAALSGSEAIGGGGPRTGQTVNRTVQRHVARQPWAAALIVLLLAADWALRRSRSL